jgi:hypothetical protein
MGMGIGRSWRQCLYEHGTNTVQVQYPYFYLLYKRMLFGLY